MKKGIHPEVKDCTVTCACGETFTCKSTKIVSVLKYVLNVIHSILENKVEHLVLDVLINSTKNMDLINKNQQNNLLKKTCENRFFLFLK